MVRLDVESGGSGQPLVEVLPPSAQTAVAFGTPSAHLLQTWRDAATCGVLLDLLYGVVAWSTMTERWIVNAASTGDAEIVYINCGGHDGLMSQLSRYRRAGILDETPDAVMTAVKQISSRVGDVSMS